MGWRLRAAVVSVAPDGATSVLDIYRASTWSSVPFSKKNLDASTEASFGSRVLQRVLDKY